MVVDSILFDLDGTLWDSCAALVAPWNFVAEGYGVPKKLTLEDMRGIMGLQIEEIGEKLFGMMGREKGIEIAKACAEKECECLQKSGGILYPGLEETLKQLQEHYPLFIVSNCECGYIEAFYKAHGLGKYFKDFENSGRTGRPKGENIQAVIRRNGLHAPVYVGDTHKDCEAAKFAGIPFIYASYGFGTVEHYEAVLHEFRELPRLLGLGY
jgi:phosphoglycolate phosphatase